MTAARSSVEHHGKDSEYVSDWDTTTRATPSGAITCTHSSAYELAPSVGGYTVPESYDCTIKGVSRLRQSFAP